MKARIIDIKKFAIHDGKGIRTTVFFKGCPLSCVWCHNPESIFSGENIWMIPENCINCGNCLQCQKNAINKIGSRVVINENCDFCNMCVENCPTNALQRIDKEITINDLVDEVLKDKIYYSVSGGGVTLSGGEPLQQSGFVIEFLKELKKRNISTCIETSLFCKENIILEVLKYIDKFYVDIKLINNEYHKKYTGVSNDRILNNFKLLAEKTDNIEVRIPLVPGITAAENNIYGVQKFVKKCNSKIKIELLNYNNLGHSKYARLGKECLCKECVPLSENEFEMYKELLK